MKSMLVGLVLVLVMFLGATFVACDDPPGEWAPVDTEDSDPPDAGDGGVDGGAEDENG